MPPIALESNHGADGWLCNSKAAGFITAVVSPISAIGTPPASTGILPSLASAYKTWSGCLDLEIVDTSGRPPSPISFSVTEGWFLLRRRQKYQKTAKARRIAIRGIATPIPILALDERPEFVLLPRGELVFVGAAVVVNVSWVVTAVSAVLVIAADGELRSWVVTAVSAVLVIAADEELWVSAGLGPWLDSGAEGWKETGRLENDPSDASAPARLAIGTITSGKSNPTSKSLQKLRMMPGAPGLPSVCWDRNGNNMRIAMGK
jgi:hypothetical protein